MKFVNLRVKIWTKICVKPCQVNGRRIKATRGEGFSASLSLKCQKGAWTNTIFYFLLSFFFFFYLPGFSRTRGSTWNLGPRAFVYRDTLIYGIIKRLRKSVGEEGATAGSWILFTICPKVRIRRGFLSDGDSEARMVVKSATSPNEIAFREPAGTDFHRWQTEFFRDRAVVEPWNVLPYLPLNLQFRVNDIYDWASRLPRFCRD